MDNIRKFGQRLKIEESKTTKVLKEKEVFIENVSILEEILQRSDKLFNGYSIDLYMYEEPFLQIIENLFLIKYGEIVSEIVFWYLYDRKDDEGNIYPLVFEEEDKEPVDVILKTPTDLWKFINKNLNNTK
jgi:hypothetical protein